jgi:hypothetical protein
MSVWARWCLVATLLLAGLVPAAVARADGEAGCRRWGACEASDTIPGKPGGGGSGGSGSSDKPPDLPSCSSFGDGYDSLPADVENPEDWVRVGCREGGIAVTLWVERQANAAQVARSLLAQLQLRPIEIGLTPRGAGAMTVVGMPVWLWVEGPSRTTWGPASIAAGGMSLTAEVESVTWELGDGTTLRCGKGTEWRPGMGGGPSPTCGHTYFEQGSYTIRARSHWVARWSGYGQSGTIPVTLAATRGLDVGEVQVIQTGG